MVKSETRHVCEYCEEAYRSEDEATSCEQTHKIQDRIDVLSNVRDIPSMQVVDEILEWLDISIEHADPVFGTATCPRCEYTVHESWTECPSCNVLLHDHSLSGWLACGECGSTSLLVGRKDGVTKGLGTRCASCGSFVAHGRGLFGVHDPTEDGFDWVDDAPF